MIMNARITRIVATFALTVLVSACEAPKNHAGSYDMQHNIRVVEEIVVVNLSVPTSTGSVLVEEENGFDRFARIFQLRAKSPITLFIDESKSDGVPRDAIVRRFVAAISKTGVRADSLLVMPGSLGHEGDAPVMATFEAYAAEAPECAEWSGESTYRWANLRHSNYGCAFQRNLALTVANPQDFIESQPMSTYGAQRGIVNIIGVESGASGAATTAE